MAEPKPDRKCAIASCRIMLPASHPFTICDDCWPVHGPGAKQRAPTDDNLKRARELCMIVHRQHSHSNNPDCSCRHIAIALDAAEQRGREAGAKEIRDRFWSVHADLLSDGDTGNAEDLKEWIEIVLDGGDDEAK